MEFAKYPKETVVRPLDSNETFLKWAAELGLAINRGHWTMTQAIRLVLPSSISDPVPYLRRAWLVLRDRHPKLGAVVISTPDGNRLSTDLGLFDKELWLSSTFFIEYSCPNSHVLFASLGFSRHPRSFWLPSTQELVINMPHWLSDGIGTLMLTHRLLAILASVIDRGLDVELGDYASDEVLGEINPPDGDKLSGYLTGDSPAARRLQDACQAIVSPMLAGLPSIGLEINPGSDHLPPGPAAHASVSLEIKTTAKVVDACHQLGISVNSAVHTAIMRVAAKQPQHPLAKTYTSLIFVNMRPHLPTPALSIASGSMVALQPISFGNILPGQDGKPNKSWLQLAAEVNTIYRRIPHKFYDPQDGGPLLSLTDVNGNVTRAIHQMMSGPPPLGLPPPQLLEYSSFGILEHHIQREYAVRKDNQKIEVVDIWKANDCLNTSVLAHGFTFRDRLTLSAGFNGGYYNASFVRAVLEDVIADLLFGLNVFM